MYQKTILGDGNNNEEEQMAVCRTRACTGTFSDGVRNIEGAGKQRGRQRSADDGGHSSGSGFNHGVNGRCPTGGGLR